MKKSTAYGILCHHSPQKIIQQLSYLWCEQNIYFFHVDSKADYRVHQLVEFLSSIYKNVHVVPSLLCSWGGISLVDAMLRICRHAVAKGEHWTHLLFLSEQHLPLKSPLEINVFLQDNTSYIECESYNQRSREGQEDIYNRFSSVYVELPGVGGFGIDSRKPTNEFLNNLWQGSQWLALSRPACKWLNSTTGAEFSSIFRQSLLPDETFIQTMIMSAGEQNVGSIDRENLTFVASPSMGGYPDMTFDEELYMNVIKNRNYLFIRKRPEVLSDAVQAHLDSIRSLDLIGIPEAVSGQFYGAGEAPHYFSEFLGRGVTTTLNEIAPHIAFVAMPSDVVGPRFFYIARHEQAVGETSTLVLSEDFLNFKVVVVLHCQFEGFEPSSYCGYTTTVLRTRAHHVAYNREVHLGRDLEHGFVRISHYSDLTKLAFIIKEFCERAAAITC